MILRGEFQRNLFHNLKFLIIQSLSVVLRHEILEQVPNIEKLVVCYGSLKEMFCCESPNNVNYSDLLLKLKELRLENLGELVSIGLENSWTDTFVRNLETFTVIGCESLKGLVTCKVSFSNLTYLKVENCKSLSHLFSSSTAKSLGQLKKMKVNYCESIEEIVYREEEGPNEDEIIFSKLRFLNLKYLENLRRFYRGSLSFPCLEKMSITDCEKMATLCLGTLKEGKLSQVKLGEFPEALQPDLNSTIQKKYLKKVCVSHF